jgi:sulfite reductase beta subunit-like hemoprotein
MYRQDKFDREPVASRIAVFRDQIERRLAGEITEEQFRPMRRTNGVYLRDHAYMLRIPVPNGVLSSTQLRMLAHIARHYDRGYAHFTADQNVEFQWPALSDTPSALTDLAAVDLYPTGAGSSVIGDSSIGRTAEAAHRPSDPMSVTIPLDGACDLSDRQMEILADLAETYGLGELHLVGGQDIVLPHVATADLAAFHAGLASSGFRNRRHSDPAPFTEEHHARETEAA